MPSLIQIVHLQKQLFHMISQFLGEGYRHSASDSPIIEGTFRNIAAQHFLQAHCLTTELEGVSGVLAGTAPLILHRIGLPKALFATEGNPGAAPTIFLPIAQTRKPKIYLSKGK